ncbi:hypothetical protein F2P56_014621 [Juglans regia]|uniref:Two-component response regulator-like APRR3 n=2 Tax=Juglans regia TaxID=51240 RepID=A0A2I4ETR8_JUGRE|nr:two-component response regulator-like APRR3 [Juglans regia]KAF5464550.1 hypothetical protein F2P56_014621 [Juglans regia]
MMTGEAAACTGEGIEMERKYEDAENKDGPGDNVVKWERLRVLLVEADYSTRQIITALLRKCSYRVAAVPDGLMAWETLKGRPHNIDIILTEVELPSISGFALLTLVMEHDICKNIPVIMMSSHDSISMVLKCMLKGAADFLIKPVRKNELRNLWQHVWRRHTGTGGHIPQNSAVQQRKVEATFENIAPSNNSSDCVASTLRNIESSEKESDAHSSCTTPYSEAEGAYMQNMQGPSQKNWTATNLSNSVMGKHVGCAKLDKESVMPDSENGEKSNRSGSEVAPYREVCDSTALRFRGDHACAESITHNEGVQEETNRGNAGIASKVHGRNDEVFEPSSGAIDLIGTFHNQPKCIYLNSNNKDGGTNKFEFVPHLELSLRRTCSSNSNYQGAEERPTLNHSSASAFSWYDSSKILQPHLLTPSRNWTKLEEGGSKSHELSSNQLSRSLNCTFLQLSQEKLSSTIIGPSRQGELKFPSLQLGTNPVPGTRYDNSCDGYSHVLPVVLYNQSGPPTAWSPKAACQRDQSPLPSSTSVQSNPVIQNSEQGYHHSDETTESSIHLAVHEDNNLKPVEEHRHGSPAVGQTSSLCNGPGDQSKGVAYGNSSKGIDETAPATAPESWNETGLSIHDGSRRMDSLRSSHREAALTKFRLKRKERCFEKKVRYHSRKRLAEQRPRVKGQFVRQVQTD